MSLNDAQQLFAFFFAIYFYMIIDRSHATYQAWDTYAAWSGKSHTINRLLAAWLLLIILPVTQFAILFTLVGVFNVTFDPTLNGVLRIIQISISSFFTFGYFRLYESLMHGYPSPFFSEEDQKKSGREIRPHFRAHLVPGILYIAVSTLLLVIALYF